MYGLDELRGQKGVGDLCALAHDGSPDGKLCVVAGSGQREVVAVVAQALHDVLVNDSEDEAIKGAVRDLLGVCLAVDRSDLGFLTVEDVRGGLEALLGSWPAIEKQREGALTNAEEGVEALSERKLEVDEGDVLAASSVGGVLVRLLLAHDILELRGVLKGASQVLFANTARTIGRLEVANLNELLLQDRNVALGPGTSLAAVALGTPEVDNNDGEEERQDVHLHLEVIERGALPHAVPLGVGELAACEARRRGGDRRGCQRGGMVYRRGVGCARVVSEVCAPCQ